MRIRKHAKIASLLFPHASTREEQLETHVCQLNQSPWDVINFAFESTSIINPAAESLFEQNDSSQKNASFGDSIGPFESSSSMKISCEIEENAEVDEDYNAAEKKIGLGNVNSNNNGDKMVIISCNKTDGKGWQCRREAKEGHSLCDHHLAQLRSYHNNNLNSSSNTKVVPEKVPGGGRRPRGSKLASTAAANPSEFYYYSGFGPLWGKKRGGKELKNSETKKDAVSTTAESSSSYVDNGVIHLVEFEDDEDDYNEEDEEGTKRKRKPIKARSLKSLM